MKKIISILIILLLSNNLIAQVNLKVKDFRLSHIMVKENEPGTILVSEDDDDGPFLGLIILIENKTDSIFIFITVRTIL